MFSRIARQSTSSYRPHVAALTRVRAFSRLPFRVHRGAITAPVDPIHERQRVECTWTIHRDGSFTSRHRTAWPSPAVVDALHVLSPGLTVVRVRPLEDDVVARVRVSSSSADVLCNVRVAAAWPRRAVVDFDCDRAVEGHLVTEIDLPTAETVHRVAAIGLGDVVVTDDVLYAGGRDDVADVPSKRRRHRRSRRSRTESLQLMAADESRLFVDAGSADCRLDKLRIGAWGAQSHIAMNVASLDLERSLDLAAMGGRDNGIALTTDSLIATRLRMMAIGTGELDVAVRRHFEVDAVKTVAVGRGAVHLRAPEKAETMATSQSSATIGEALVDTTSLATKRANVLAVGSNDIRLDARDALRVRNVGSSVVECVDRLPSQLDVRGLPWPTLVETPAEDLKSDSDAPPADPIPTVLDAFAHAPTPLTSRRSTLFSRVFGSREKRCRERKEERSSAPPRRRRHRWEEY